MAERNGQPVLLRQLAQVKFAAAAKRGDAGYNGKPAVVVSVQKQPQADSTRLTADIEAALASLSQRLPAGVQAPQVSFRQADFIQASVANVAEALRDGAIMVALILFLFLLNVRTTLISLTAIPLSLAVTLAVFHALDQSINVMTLGGLAIAIGELVDDALVDVENVLRRLKALPAERSAADILRVIIAACNEVRSGVVVATLVVVLVFVPLFALPGIEGRLFAPLGVAYITSILSSLLVALTVTPVLCYWLLPTLAARQHADSWLVRQLKRLVARALDWGFARWRALCLSAAVLGALVLLSAAWLPRVLPAFNEGTLTVSLLLNPGAALSESNRVGQLAEQLLLTVPEVKSVGRRTGRAELDEHAEGVHSSELDVDLRPSARRVRRYCWTFASVRPACRRRWRWASRFRTGFDHLLSGVRAQIAIKLYGDDLDTLRGQAAQLRDRLAGVAGLADLQVEKQVLIPQIKVRVDYAQAAQYGVAPGALLARLEALTEGRVVSQIADGARRFQLVIRLPDAERDLTGLGRLLIDTPHGAIPLAQLAQIEEATANQIGRENGRRRMVIAANTDGRDMAAVIADIRAALAATPLPAGYFVSLEGQFRRRKKPPGALPGWR